MAGQHFLPMTCPYILLADFFFIGIRLQTELTQSVQIKNKKCKRSP
jgi:hypothetical protein